MSGWNPNKRFYILYDGRARSGDSDDGTVLDTADTRSEARRVRKEGVRKGYRYYQDSVWYEYEVEKDGITLVNGRMRLDLSPLFSVDKE